MFYFANVMPFQNNSIYGSLLLSIINRITFENNPKPIIDNILTNLKRQLTVFEKETLDKWLQFF